MKTENEIQQASWQREQEAARESSPSPSPLKYRSVDAQLWLDMENMLASLMTLLEYMVQPTPQKERLLTKARGIYARAQQFDKENG